MASPKLSNGHKFMKNGVLWEVRGMDIRPDGIYYSAVPYESFAKDLNWEIIVVREDEVA